MPSHETSPLLTHFKVSFPEGQTFPLILEPLDSSNAQTVESLISLIQSSGEETKLLMRRYGGVWFRGFPIKEPKDFHDVVTAAGMDPLPYVGGAGNTLDYSRL